MVGTSNQSVPEKNAIESLRMSKLLQLMQIKIILIIVIIGILINIIDVVADHYRKSIFVNPIILA